MVDKKAEAIAKEIQGFKDKCKILYKRNFPSFFDGNGDLYCREPLMTSLFPLMTSLFKVKNCQKGFGEEDHALYCQSLYRSF